MDRNPGYMPRAPPDSYAWNNLIQDIIEAMDDADVNTIKRRFEDIIPVDLGTAEEIMDFLKQNGYISECDIVYLQQIVRVLNKNDLVEKTIYYANESSQKVLHFHKTRIVPSPGCQLFKVHVRGFTHATPAGLDDLRNRISQIIQAPRENISFAGIKETNSLIITLMLPKMYVEVLQDLLCNPKKHYLFAPLLEINVDEIIISEKSFKINVDREKCEALENSGLNIDHGDLKMEHELRSVEKSDDMPLEDKTANQTVGQKRKAAFPEQDDTEGIPKKLKLWETVKLPTMEHLNEVPA